MTPEERAQARERVQSLLPRPGRSDDDVLAEAIGKAMASPRREVTVFSDADRSGALAEAAKLRARAARLEDLVNPDRWPQ